MSSYIYTNYFVDLYCIFIMADDDRCLKHRNMSRKLESVVVFLKINVKKRGEKLENFKLIMTKV